MENNTAQVPDSTGAEQRHSRLLPVVLIVIIVILAALLIGTQMRKNDSAGPAAFAYLADDTYVRIDGEQSTLAEAVDEILADADAYMAELNVSREDQAAVDEDVREQLYFLQDKTESRILGDHGILHVITNWQKSKNYLATRPDASTEICLAVLIAQVYHDTGYSVYPCNVSANSPEASTADHDLFSAVIEESDDTADVYRNIFSDDVWQRILYAVRTHNSEDKAVVLANTAVDSDIIALTLNLSDKCALSLRDKLPGAFSNCPEAFQMILDNPSDDYGEAFQEKLLAVYDTAPLDTAQKADYEEMAETELNTKRINKAIRMLFCYMPEDCVRYNADTNQNDIVIDRVSYGIDGEQKMERKVVSKLIEDLVMQEPGESDDAYDARIREIYEAACLDGGAMIDEARGLHLTVNEIAAADIPGSEYDYLQYHITL